MYPKEAQMGVINENADGISTWRDLFDAVNYMLKDVVDNGLIEGFTPVTDKKGMHGPNELLVVSLSGVTRR